MLCRTVVFAVVLSLIAGYTESQSQLKADPDPCPQYECRTIHAYWEGEQSTYVWALYIGDNTADHGTEPLFTTNSVEKKPRLPVENPPTMLDLWAYTSCTPFCGKVAGKWQATQEVLTSGESELVQTGYVARRQCTANGGSEGPQIDPPVNSNVKGFNPPGVK